MDEKIINNIKILSVEMINEAGSGHPGIALGAAPIIYTLFDKYLNYNVKDDNWINRDRFVMSAGHGSALLYATMYMAGYNITLDDLKKFRTLNSITPGHPEYGITKGIESSTGPLGQGIATAIGMALGEKILENRYIVESTKEPLVNYHVYALVSDGDLMEGISYEACSFAGQLNLNNLIILYDSNDITLDGDIKNSFNESIGTRFNAMGWYYDLVKNGKSVNEIDKAIEKALKSGKPSIIEIKTVIGSDSYMEGTNKAHGTKLEEYDIDSLKIKYNLPDTKFYIDEEAKKIFSDNISKRSIKKYEKWVTSYREYVQKMYNGDYSKLNYLLSNKLSINLLNYDFRIKNDLNEATRITNGYILNQIVELIPDLIIGGSADLSNSTKTYLEHYNDIKKNEFKGKNIWFGIREHSMGAILNGLALSNFRPFASTFLAFADYMKPTIRLSALMDLPVTYIFTHDSVNLGQDGPTHQPIEQLAMLRSIPNFYVYRPADAKELIGSWHCILNSAKPSALILSRQDLKLLNNSSSSEVSKGGYIVRKEIEKIHGIIIATGSEVDTAINIANELFIEYKLDLRVISMPSLELFDRQPKDYKKTIIPEGYKTFVLEAGTSFGWGKFVYNEDYLITIDKFGVSAKPEDVLKYLNFDKESIKERIINMYK